MPDMTPSRTARAACQPSFGLADARIVASAARPACNTPSAAPAARWLARGVAVAGLALLAACGQKGPLFIPDDAGKPIPPTTSATYPSAPTTTRTTSQNRSTFPTLP
jgi:predicted small lipoprotein YifL